MSHEKSLYKIGNDNKKSIYNYNFLFYSVGNCREIVLPREVLDEDFDFVTIEMNWQQVTEGRLVEDFDKRNKVHLNSGDELTFKETLPSIEDDRKVLCFRTVKLDYEVYINGQLRGSYSTADTRLFGDTSPSIYLFISVERKDSGGEIMIRVSSKADIEKGAKYHHEKFHGSGYPEGLKGEEIPECARIICVADAYDAMTSNRSYRNVMSQDQVRAEIVRGKGIQFDPQIADIMIKMIDEDKDYVMQEHGSKKKYRK